MKFHIKAPSGRELSSECETEGECAKIKKSIIASVRRLLPSRQAVPPPSQREAIARHFVSCKFFDKSKFEGVGGEVERDGGAVRGRG